ncbi:MAG: coenzyme F420-0:L-glutamate ligase [Deltaproteobacteria bacterium]|nr:coenzyme F420-0:L-glutamate ligase [Deltaproteobacteria bacterium]
MSFHPKTISIIPIIGIPEIKPGDDLVRLVTEAAFKQDISITNGDLVVFAQKIISKAEGRVVKLSDVSPSPFAVQIASELNKDPQFVEVILGETKRIVKMDRKLDRGMLIVESKQGIICANAGIDASNVSGGEMVTLLPIDPDESAKKLAEGFKEKLGVEVLVIITDTVGRPWREGLTEIAIGCWGMKPLKDYRGHSDSKGYKLSATLLAVADEIAGAAGLVMGKNDSVPVVIVRGYTYEPGGVGARELIRKPEDDLFR